MKATRPTAACIILPGDTVLTAHGPVRVTEVRCDFGCGLPFVTLTLAGGGAYRLHAGQQLPVTTPTEAGPPDPEPGPGHAPPAPAGPLPPAQP